MTNKIFLLQPDRSLVEMTGEAYETEDLLQVLLADYPNLLAGDQIDRVAPRRWVLVRREQGVPDSAGASARWSLDHLFLDQDAVPTLVEVKRASDTRIRREVVAQMLDYAANGVVYWPVAEMRAAFEATCSTSQLSPDQAIAQLTEDDVPIDEYWRRVDANLSAGRIRLVFVADAIPPELRRIIEFLNEQMQPAEVIGVEIKQYVGNHAEQPLRTLVPTVLGLTEKARSKHSGSESRAAALTVEEWYKELEDRRGEAAVMTARNLIEWFRQHADFVEHSNTGQSFAVAVVSRGKRRYPFQIWREGVVTLNLMWLKSTSAFGREEDRAELISRVNSIPGVKLGTENPNGAPTFKIVSLNDPLAMAQFQEHALWALQRLRNA